MSRREQPLVPRLPGLDTTIFSEMSALAAATGSVNLGQGFPDTDGPEDIKKAAIEAILAGHNQYPPLPGIFELRAAIADHQRSYYGLDFDPDSEILVTAGATEAITAALIALCVPGDEVILFEPFYDSYGAGVTLAGASRRTVQLEAPKWSFEPDALAAAVTERTRLVVVNSPHNPTGKVFSDSELAVIARCCVENNLLAITDEVYEHLIYEGAHRPLASFPGMAERTVTISSAAKTFSFTGWKVGWACGPSALIRAVRTVKQFLTFVNGAPFQYAITLGLGASDRYIAPVADGLRARRDLLSSGLKALGLEVFDSPGTFFLMTDIRTIGEDDGAQFCRGLAKRCGVVAIPASAFYDDVRAGRSLVRWTFCKRPEVLEEALERLASLG